MWALSGPMQRVSVDKSGRNGEALTKEHEGGRERGDYRGVSALLHDRIDDGNGEAAEDCRQGSDADVGDMVRRVRVSDGVELELAIEAHEPGCESEEELRERRVHVEVVFALPEGLGTARRDARGDRP